MPKLPTTDWSYLGIDPGASGGLCLLSKDKLLYGLWPMPEDQFALWDRLTAIKEFCADNKLVAVIEKVWGYTGGEGNPGSAMFSFGAGYGGLTMALIALAIPFREVPPRNWQKHLGIPNRDNKKETKPQWKRRLKSEAQKRFPQAQLTLLTCDALLIAEYCRLTSGV